jgi:hypothetical protein
LVARLSVITCHEVVTAIGTWIELFQPTLIPLYAEEPRMANWSDVKYEAHANEVSWPIWIAPGLSKTASAQLEEPL